jgi:Holliday junction resolvase-like predicted endonuclease
LGYTFVRENWHLKWAEIDLLFYHEKTRTLKIVEVRGRRSKKYLPSRMISWIKQKRLKNLALVVSHRYKKTTSVDLAEVLCIGDKISITIYGGVGF